MYGKHKLSAVNDVHMQLFLEKYRPVRGQTNITGAKKLDASMMQPCKKVPYLRRVLSLNGNFYQVSIGLFFIFLVLLIDFASLYSFSQGNKNSLRIMH